MVASIVNPQPVAASQAATATRRTPFPAAHSCDDCAVRRLAICDALGSAELEELSAIGRLRSLAPGEALIWEGDDSLLVGNVIEGVLMLSASSSEGREQIVGVVYPSDFIGRPFGGAARQSVTALTDARVCVFARSEFDRFATDHPALEHRLLQRTLTELDRARRWMLLLGRKSAEQRIAAFLLDLCRRLDPADGAASCEPSDSTELPFSRQQVGDVLGLTIETVSRQFTRLKKAGLIDLPSRRVVVIRDRARLEALAG